MGTYARIEISQGADNADQKVKWFLKVIKHTKFYGKHIIYYVFPKILFTLTFYKCFDYHPNENES